jgi:hypothetical protein
MIIPGNMGLSKACGTAFANFLKGLSFTGYTNDNQPVTYKFINVNDEWSPPTKQLEYPSASIAIPVQESYEPFGFTPVVYDDSYDPVSNTSIVKYGEWTASLFLTIWASDFWMRDAIVEGIEANMNPTLDRMGMFLPVPANYGLDCRYTLIDAKKLDTQEFVFRNELQTLITIKTQADYVRRVAIPFLQPNVTLTVT